MRDNLVHLPVECRRNPDNVFGFQLPQARARRVTIGPRFTASIHTVARSTVGAAGFSSMSRHVISPSAGDGQSQIDRHPDQLLLRDAFSFNIHKNPASD